MARRLARSTIIDKRLHDTIEIATRLIDARNGGPFLIPQEIGQALPSSAEAYEVQRIVADAIGPVGAFKTARRPGQAQIMAPIFQKDIQRTPAVFARDQINRIGIELEVGFLVKAPLPAATDADFAEKARRCVSAVAVLEIVDTRLAEIDPAPPPLRLADNQLNGALVVGEPLDDWQELDLETVTATLKLGDETVLDGAAPVPGGDAFRTFCGLAQMVGSHCGGLRPGHVVITGSLNGMPFIERGTSVRGWIDGLGAVEADFPR